MCFDGDLSGDLNVDLDDDLGLEYAGDCYKVTYKILSITNSVSLYTEFTYGWVVLEIYIQFVHILNFILTNILL